MRLRQRRQRTAGCRARHAAKPARPFLIFDSVTPSAIPAHHMIATYATGGYAVPASQVAGRQVLWIDTRGTDPAAAALDVEPGDATPSVAAQWAWHKLSATPGTVARIYTMISEWPAVKAAVAGLPHRMQSHVRYWIADPTGVPHIVPGASATQWYWGKNYLRRCCGRSSCGTTTPSWPPALPASSPNLPAKERTQGHNKGRSKEQTRARTGVPKRNRCERFKYTGRI